MGDTTLDEIWKVLANQLPLTPVDAQPGSNILFSIHTYLYLKVATFLEF